MPIYKLDKMQFQFKPRVSMNALELQHIIRENISDDEMVEFLADLARDMEDHALERLHSIIGDIEIDRR